MFLQSHGSGAQAEGYMNKNKELFRYAKNYNFERYQKEGKTDVYLIKTLARCFVWFGIIYFIFSWAQQGVLPAFLTAAAAPVIKWILGIFDSKLNKDISYGLDKEPFERFSDILKMRMFVKLTDVAEYVYCFMLIRSIGLIYGGPSGWLGAIAAYIVSFIIFEVCAYISHLIFRKKGEE